MTFLHRVFREPFGSLTSAPKLELVDPIVADPIRQDNDTRKNKKKNKKKKKKYIYIYIALDRFAAYILAQKIKISPVL